MSFTTETHEYVDLGLSVKREPAILEQVVQKSTEITLHGKKRNQKKCMYGALTSGVRIKSME